MEDVFKYSVIAPKVPGSLVIFTFSAEERLIGIEFNPDASETFICKVGGNLPLTRRDLMDDMWSGCEIEPMHNTALSFDLFWRAYQYKVGNRKRVAQRWAELPDSDKILAIGYIRRYRNWCHRKGIEQCYPETYLNQRRWENHLD